MKTCITGGWIKEVARANGITDGMNPNLVNKLIQDVEAQTRMLIVISFQSLNSPSWFDDIVFVREMRERFNDEPRNMC